MSTITQLSDSEIAARIDNSPQLASLRSINSALSELINADNSFTSQIAEIIRRDPSLTSRLLKMVNSVFFGLSRRVNNIEEAIFYLGLRQIRELALATPVIEDFDNLSAGFKNTNWKLLWQHSIGTAIFSREILAVANVPYEDETDYIIGLVHNVGKIVIAFCFPDELQEIISFPARTTEEVCLKEREVIGWDHAKIGAYYLKRHRLSPEIVETTEYHNRPEDAPRYKKSSAAVQLSDHMVRFANIPGMEETDPVSEKDWPLLSGWNILFGTKEEESDIGIASLSHSLSKLPIVLKGII